MANNPVHYKKYKVLSTVFANITPIKNLTIRTQFGADYSHSTAFMQSYPSYIINNNMGSAGRNSSDVLTLSETTTANYRWELNESHSLNFLLGQEAVNFESTGFQVISKGQANDKLTNVTSGTRASAWRIQTVLILTCRSSSAANTTIRICTTRKWLPVRMLLTFR